MCNPYDPSSTISQGFDFPDTDYPFHDCFASFAKSKANTSKPKEEDTKVQKVAEASFELRNSTGSVNTPKSKGSIFSKSYGSIPSNPNSFVNNSNSSNSPNSPNHRISVTVVD
ncbi:hypothetical protein [Parachlamydia acanthamoebae]|uniref:hypothetical protein n=1 Tax=Parachlamydia acanthamoebae TaxID=83552 RepID=UPI0001C179A4|nr:hypothetical protein [Parachlamydia acanthamoebae]EFB40438.1 hypothetical protein pah_c205o091 [Parachlamydia acanthamoebae str. Hall's coccus]